jgi:hypothetical protein
MHANTISLVIKIERCSNILFGGEKKSCLFHWKVRLSNNLGVFEVFLGGDWCYILQSLGILQLAWIVKEKVYQTHLSHVFRLTTNQMNTSQLLITYRDLQSTMLVSIDSKWQTHFFHTIEPFGTNNSLCTTFSPPKKKSVVCLQLTQA